MVAILSFCIVNFVFYHEVKGHIVKREFNPKPFGEAPSLDFSKRESVQVKMVSRRHRREESSSSSTGEILEIRRENGNSTIQLHLSTRDEILSPDFTFVVHDGSNRSVISDLSGPQNAEDCYYSGTVREYNDDGSEKAKNLGKVVLSACGETPGFNGLIKTSDGNFVLEPELKWAKVVGVSDPTLDTVQGTEGQKMETLLTKSDDNDGDDGTLYTMTPLINFDKSQENTGPHPCFSESQSSPSNSNDDEQNNVELRPAESPLNIKVYTTENDDEQQIISRYAGRRRRNNGGVLGRVGGDGGSGVIHDPKSDGRPVVELALFADSSFVTLATPQVQGNSLKNLKNYMVNLALTMAIHFEDSSLNVPVTLTVASIEIFKQNPANLNTANGNMDTYLNSWCVYQHSLNPNGDKWDHAMILTGLDIGNHQSNNPVGNAKVSGMCTTKISCSIVETKSFFSAIAMTHELGHSLGMNHDGQGANGACSPTANIMAALLSEKQTATWSDCSSANMESFLASPLKGPQGYTKCLLKPANSETKKQKSISFGGGKIKLPGQIVSGSDQCVMKFGKGSPYPVLLSTEFDIQNFDFCKAMYCKGVNRKPVPGEVAYYAHPPLEGTDCESGKWCREGRCVSKS